MITEISKKITIEKTSGKMLPLYEQVRRNLRHAIESNQLKPGQALPSISGLVREWKVNPRTIKQAFDLLEQDGLILQKPWKGAVVASSASPQHSIAFFRWCSDVFCMNIMEGVQRYFRQENQEAFVIDACGNHENFINVLKHPPEGTKGLIMTPFASPEYKAAILEAKDKGLKIVFVDRTLPGFSVSAVVSDNFVGAYQAVTHLLEAHHEPVYYIGNTASPSSVRERVRGWQAAMLEHNYLYADSYLVELSSEEEEMSEKSERHWLCSKDAALKFFDRVKQDRYCIFTGNDAGARGIYMAAEERGLVVGKDVFIVGFDDAPFCTKLSPALSSVHQVVDQLGFEAAKLLHQELTGTVKPPICKVLPVELKIRESSIGFSND